MSAETNTLWGAFTSMWQTLTPNNNQSQTYHPCSNLPSNWMFFSKEAIVAETIYPQVGGKVRLNGSWWSARCEDNLVIPKGEMVYVVGICSVTLLVKPMG